MKKYIVLIVIVLVIFGFITYRRNSAKTVVVPPITVEQQLELSSDWVQVTDTKSELKLEKKTENGLKPQIVLTSSTSVDAKTPSKYVDRLISGARSAIPSLKITTDKRTSEEDKFTAILTGYYYNKSQKVSFIQRVYLKGESVSVLTSSYSGDQDQEINSILDTIVKQKI